MNECMDFTFALAFSCIGLASNCVGKGVISNTTENLAYVQHHAGKDSTIYSA
jgi:hypothetical protein